MSPSTDYSKCFIVFADEKEGEGGLSVADLTAFNQHDTYLWHHTHTVGLTSQEGEGEAYWDKLEGIADKSIPTQKTQKMETDSIKSLT